MAGGITINGTSGNNLEWETDGGGDVGDSSGANRPNNAYILNAINLGYLTSTSGQTYINLSKYVASFLPSQSGPLISFWDGATGSNSWAIGVANNRMHIVRGGDAVVRISNGEFILYDGSAPYYLMDATQFYIYNKTSAKNIVFQTNSDSNSTAAQGASIIGSDKTAGTGNGGSLTVKAGDSAGGTGGAATLAGGAGSAGNSSGGDAVVAGGTKSGSGTAGSVRLKTSGSDRLVVDNAGKVTLGSSGGSEVHMVNGATASAASGTLTFTNAPSGVSGNPSIYLKLNVNGTDYVFPGFAM